MRARSVIESGLVVVLLGLTPSRAVAGELPGPPSSPHRNCAETRMSQSPASPATVTVPAQTEFAIEMLSGLHSRVSHVGDPIVAEVRQPVSVQGKLALPLGTLLFGRVNRLRPAGHFHRPAQVTLRFDRVALPDGDVEPVRAVLVAFESAGKLRVQLDSEGYLKGKRRPAWKGLAASVVPLGVLGVVRAGASHGPALEAIFPLGAAGVVAYWLVWPRGEEIHVPPQTPCRIRLSYPLTLRATT